MNEKLNIFFAYARSNQSIRNRLDIHLAGMKRRDFINTWYDGKIEPGKKWEEEIESALSNADIILLLISPEFLASDYCYDIEMKRAIERHENDTAVVIPIILTHCDWKDAPFSEIQVLPKDAVPIMDSKWYNEDEGMHNVTIGIKSIVSKMVEERNSKKLQYHKEKDKLKSEIEEIKLRIKVLSKQEESLKSTPQKEFLNKITEQEKLIKKQETTIYELKKHLSQFVENTSTDSEIINQTKRAVITNTGQHYSTINETDSHDGLWPNNSIKKLAGVSEWAKHGFQPEKGMEGEIVGSFRHYNSKTFVYILKIDDKYYVPMGEEGIKFLN